MSAVKNLRAMFENKGDDPNPPDRGRSPAFGSPGPNSPRPLSKVRSNFVAIEKDGKLGLVRQDSYQAHSPSPSPTRWRPTSAMDPESLTSNPPENAFQDTPRRLFVAQQIPESSSLRGTGAVNDHPSLNPDKQVDQEQPPLSLTTADPTENPTNLTKSKTKVIVSNSKQKVDTEKNKGATASTGPAKKTTTTRSKTPTTKPTTKPPVKQPVNVKPSSASTKRPEPKPVSKPTSQTTKKPVAPTKLSGAMSKPLSTVRTRTPAPAPIKISQPSATGFVKPKPKSPTKPVRLPPSLMAPTASSGAKAGDVRQSLSRQGGHLQASNGVTRSSSRASVSTIGTSTTKTIKRQPSTMSGLRPSVGPPPKKTQEHSLPKRESQVDESFLARMMRPTQASASKLTEKAPITPPRKMSHRPSMSTLGAESRRGSSVKKHAQRPSPMSGKAYSQSDSDAALAISEDKGLGMANFEATGEVLPLAKETEVVQALVEPKEPEPIQVENFEEAVSSVESTLETAKVETAEIDIIENPVEPTEPKQKSVLAPVDDIAKETATVETAEAATAIAKEAGFSPCAVQSETEPEDAKDHSSLNLAMSSLSLSSPMKDDESKDETTEVDGDSDSGIETADPAAVNDVDMTSVSKEAGTELKPDVTVGEVGEDF